jgi:hypothetical protein
MSSSNSGSAEVNAPLLTTHLVIGFTNPAAGREEGFNSWYDEHHFPDALTNSNYRRGQRFKRLETAIPTNFFRYVALYEIVSDDIEATFDKVRWSLSEDGDWDQGGVGLFGPPGGTSWVVTPSNQEGRPPVGIGQLLVIDVLDNQPTEPCKASPTGPWEFVESDVRLFGTGHWAVADTPLAVRLWHVDETTYESNTPAIGDDVLARMLYRPLREAQLHGPKSANSISAG